MQYGTFAVTALLYLNDYGSAYTGGRFVFRDSNSTTTRSFVEPKAGRLSFFTSGHENVHYVEPVASGERWALTIAFSCSAKDALPPNFLLKRVASAAASN